MGDQGTVIVGNGKQASYNLDVRGGGGETITNNRVKVREYIEYVGIKV